MFYEAVGQLDIVSSYQALKIWKLIKFNLMNENNHFKQDNVINNPLHKKNNNFNARGALF